MAIIESPFAALQLVGLMLPVVVLTLKAHVTPLRDQERHQGVNLLGQSPNQHKVRRASAVAIMSLLSFIGSAFVVLVGQFVATVDPMIVLVLWAATVGLGFLAYTCVVGLWLYELLRPQYVELL